MYSRNTESFLDITKVLPIGYTAVEMAVFIMQNTYGSWQVNVVVQQGQFVMRRMHMDHCYVNQVFDRSKDIFLSTMLVCY